MSDRPLAQLDRLLSAQRLTLQAHGAGYTLELGAVDREELIGHLMRLIVGLEVRVLPRRPAKSGAGTCKFCGLDVLWVQSATSDTKIPLDRRPLQIVDDFGVVHRGREAHQSSCPKRNEVIAEKAQRGHRGEVETT